MRLVLRGLSFWGYLTLLTACAEDLSADINNYTQVDFLNFGSVDLTTYLSDTSARSMLDTTFDPDSSLYFRWVFFGISSEIDWREDRATPELLEIPELATTYYEDLRALFYQGNWAFIGNHSIPTLMESQPLPENYYYPMLLVASGLNRLRDLPDNQKQSLYAIAFNHGPLSFNLSSKYPQDDLVREATPIISFSGLSSSEYSPSRTEGASAICSASLDTSGYGRVTSFTNVDIVKTSLEAKYMNNLANNVMLVWAGTTAGNRPFSGTWEWTYMPGTTFKQIACDTLPVASCGNVEILEYAYETSWLERSLSSEEEMALYSEMRTSFCVAEAHADCSDNCGIDQGCAESTYCTEWVSAEAKSF